MHRMQARLAAWWPHASALKKEPGAALFKQVRVRLTFWYCAVLGCALLLFCIALYFGVRQLLYTPVQRSLPQASAGLVDAWQHNPTFNCASPPSPQRPSPRPELRRAFNDLNNIYYIVCYNPSLHVLRTSQDAALPSKIVSPNSVVEQAYQTKSVQSGIVENNGPEGRIYCYVAPVFDLQNQDLVGFVLVGHPLGELDNALNALLTLLVIGGTVVLLGAGLGGLFLANRALQPTREAYTRQQRFIADASHELRTPLTFLCANTEILLDGRDRLDPDDVSLLEDIYIEANHMNTLANNMLALARLDVGEGHFHREHDIVDLSKLAESITHQGKAVAQKNGIELHFERTGSVLVVGDPVLLRQVALILLDNALKYNRPNGSVNIRAFLSKGRAFLSFSDTGIGMAPEHLTRLGERFYRVDKARSRAVGGTGLGLSIAYSIAHTHNGSLELTSTLDVGTTATFSLPALPTVSGDHATITGTLLPLS